MLLPATTARASIALFILRTLNTVQARYLPPQTAPYAQRDDNSYRLKSYGSGYKTALASNNNGTSGLTVEGDDVVYSVNIVIGGHEVALQIDTGSTDLWVFAPEGSIKTSNTTNISTELRYSSGQLDGTIQFADVQIGPYTVPNQAFLNATTTQGMDVMFQRNIFGILGLGFTERTPDFTPSAINAALQHAFGNDSTLGESVIGNIYKLNTSLPNSFDIHIGRSSDLDDVSDGLFNIGEHVPGHEAVEQRPKLPRISPGRWGVPLDGFEVNGESVPMGNKSVVPGAPDGKLIAVLDTGATLPQIPWNVYKTIYDSIPGAVYDNGYGSWFLPCDATVNLTVVMGGEPIPIHPLDITRVIVLQAELNGTLTNTTVCTDAWQAFDLPPSFTGLDILMGDSFLRNVYASYDFGDQGTEDNSFIQLLPTTDANAAWSEFFTMRAEALSKLPPAYPPADLFKWAANSQPASTASSTTSSPATQPVSVDDESTSSVTDAAMRLSDSDNANAAATAGTLDKWGPVVVGLLAGNLFVTLVLCAIGVGLYLKGRRGARQPVRNLNTVSYGPVMTKDRDVTEYSDSFMVNARQ